MHIAMTQLTLQVLPDEYSIHRFSSGQAIPPAVFTSPLYFLAKTDDELSIVCPSDIAIDAPKTEAHWRCLKVLGPLDFSLTGILAKLATILAQADVSIFAVSTYDTDYLLVQKANLEAARQALSQAGYQLQ